MGTVHLKGKEESRPMLKLSPLRQCFWQRRGGGERRGGEGRDKEEAARSMVSNTTQQIRRGQRNSYTFGSTKAAWNLDMAFVRW